MYIYIYIYIYYLYILYAYIIYIFEHEFDKGMRELDKYKKKKLLKVKPEAEVLAFGAYMFESLHSFNNSQVKAHTIFSMSKLHLICQNCRTSAISICY